MNDMSQFDATAAAFLIAAQAKVTADYLRFSPGREAYAPKLSFERGKRFVRIVAATGQGAGTSRGAFGFIDTTNGDVLKAASWKSPAKNFARGNIFGEQNGCGRICWTGVS